MSLNAEELRGNLAHAAKSAQDLKAKADKENREFTLEEAALFDAHISQTVEIKAKITAVEAHAERMDTLAKLTEELKKPVGRSTSPTVPGEGTPNGNSFPAASWAQPKRNGALQAFKGDDAERKAYKCGMWARAHLLKDQRAARWLNNYTGIDINAALGGNSDPNGGYLVPEEFTQAIIDLREQYGVFRRNCQVMPMGSDTMLIPRRAGGVTVAFTDENPAAAISQSNPTWSQVRLTAKKLAGLTLMSTEIAEDAIIDLADWLAREFAYALATKEDQCGFNGDGTSTYGGIEGVCNYLVAGASLVGAVDATSGVDTFAEVTATDLARCMAALPEYARAGAKWYCSSVCLDLVFGRLMAAAGGNNIQNLMGGYGYSYLGYPIVISQVLQTTTSTINNVPMLLFGDLRLSSTLGDRRGMRVMPSEHRYLELDQIAIRCTQRFDIVNHDMGDTSVAGPIVALIGNS